jgi:hypothetical protein
MEIDDDEVELAAGDREIGCRERLAGMGDEGGACFCTRLGARVSVGSSQAGELATEKGVTTTMAGLAHGEEMGAAHHRGAETGCREVEA